MQSVCIKNASGNNDTTSATAAPLSAPTISMPYTPMYATDFEFGDYKCAQTLFTLMKHCDDNDFTGFESAFANTASVYGKTGKILL